MAVLSECWVLAPAVVAFLLPLLYLIINPPTASQRLATFGGAELPQDATELRYHFAGDGMTDYDDIYYFRCSSNETQRIISAMRLKKDDSFSVTGHLEFHPRPGWPDFRQWTGPVQYRRDDEPAGWSYYLLTDKRHEQVYISIGCI